MTDNLLNMMVVHRKNETISVSFRGEDKSLILKMNGIRKQLIKLISKRGTHLELDLTGIRFIDSNGFDTLNLIHQIGRKYDSLLSLIGVENEVLEMIDLLRKYHVFHIQQIKAAC